MEEKIGSIRLGHSGWNERKQTFPFDFQPEFLESLVQWKAHNVLLL